jgi:hypothetical protein
LAAEPGKAEKATDTKTEQLANDRFSIRFTLIPTKLKYCHWERLSNVSQTQVVRRIESKALGEAFVGDGSASQLAKASTT